MRYYISDYECASPSAWALAIVAVATTALFLPCTIAASLVWRVLCPLLLLLLLLPPPN